MIPDDYIRQELDWYDGSIRGMDAEMGRLFEQLRRWVWMIERSWSLTSDHGTEFLDHGRFFHGQTRLRRAHQHPACSSDGRRACLPGRAIDDLVQSIDIMPTMLDLTGIAHPEGIQGQSLQPFLAADASREPGRIVAGLERRARRSPSGSRHRRSATV